MGGPSRFAGMSSGNRRRFSRSGAASVIGERLTAMVEWQAAARRDVGLPLPVNACAGRLSFVVAFPRCARKCHRPDGPRRGWKSWSRVRRQPSACQMARLARQLQLLVKVDPVGGTRGLSEVSNAAMVSISVTAPRSVSHAGSTIRGHTRSRDPASAADLGRFEWLHNDDRSSGYGEVSLTDPFGKMNGNADRIFQGGAWSAPATRCRAAAHLSAAGWGRGPGFRLAATPGPDEVWTSIPLPTVSPRSTLFGPAMTVLVGRARGRRGTSSTAGRGTSPTMRLAG